MDDTKSLVDLIQEESARALGLSVRPGGKAVGPCTEGRQGCDLYVSLGPRSTRERADEKNLLAGIGGRQGQLAPWWEEKPHPWEINNQ